MAMSPRALEAAYAAGHTLYDIGEVAGVAPTTVQYHMKKHGIERRPPGRRGNSTLEEALRRAYGGWRRAAEEARDVDGCESCGSGGRLEAHHIVPLLAGGTHHPDNLIALCPRCHGSAHSFLDRALPDDIRPLEEHAV